MRRGRNTYRIIDLPDGRHPFGLVDPEDTVIRVDTALEPLAEYAFEDLRADRVTYLGEVVRESDRARRSDSRFER